MGYISENFFKMEIKMFDLYSLMNAEMEEEKVSNREGVLKPIESDYIVGFKLVKPEDIISWGDTYSKSETMEDIVQTGFTSTAVVVKENLEIAIYECVWKRKEFEERLDKFILFKNNAL
jgi:hypothetical protein